MCGQPRNALALPPSIEDGMARQPVPASAPSGESCRLIAMTGSTAQLGRSTCPHCWHRFHPHETLAVARHTSLRSPSVVEGALRFLPSRFNEAGNPIDPMGEECLDLACPRCYLILNRSNLTIPALFASIVGAPASGKSYYLAAALWSLRRTLQRFGWAATDASPTDNAILHANEQRLFLPADPDEAVMLAKTDQSGGELYSSIEVRGRPELLLRPFQFLLTSTATATRDQATKRLLVLYDNAGEHFQPGNPLGAEVTRHLAHSRVIMFLFDPTQDPRMRSICRKDDPQVTKGPRGGGFRGTVVRQESILDEVAHRIRTLRNVKSGDPISAALIVILAKADLHDGLRKILQERPSALRSKPCTSLDLDLVRQVSERCRSIIQESCPEFVACAEAMARKVLFIPASALGCSPEETEAADGSTFLGIQPKHIQPLWAEVPFLVALQALDPGAFPSLQEVRRNGSSTAQETCP